MPTPDGDERIASDPPSRLWHGDLCQTVAVTMPYDRAAGHSITAGRLAMPPRGQCDRETDLSRPIIATSLRSGNDQAAVKPQYRSEGC